MLPRCMVDQRVRPGSQGGFGELVGFLITEWANGTGIPYKHSSFSLTVEKDGKRNSQLEQSSNHENLKENNK